MLELRATLTDASGNQRPIWIGIGDVRKTHEGTANPWSASVKILGFERPETVRLRGRDRAEAVEDAARFAALRVGDKADADGGGTLDPPFWPRPRSPRPESLTCRIPNDDSDRAPTS
jgi:hypothetical protein